MHAQTQVKYWQSSSIPGLETSVTFHSTHAFPRHFHDGVYSIGIVDRGISYCRNKGDQSSLTTPRTTALINPGEIHTGIPGDNTPMSYRMIYLPVDLFNRFSSDILQQETLWEFTGMISEDPLLRSSIEDFHRLTMEQEDPLRIESLLFHSIAGMLPEKAVQKAVGSSAGKHKMERAEQLLRSQLDRSMSLQEIADELQMSRYHFLRCFKGYSGLTPQAYRTQRRLEKARKWLGKGRDITETALSWGFTDQSHFSRVFRKYYGSTPGQYASAIKQ